MPVGAAGVGDGAIRRPKTRGMPRRLQPLPPRRALACRPRRVLPAVGESTTRTVLHPGPALPGCRAVALALIGQAHPRDVRPPLEPRAHQLLRRLFVAPALPQKVADVLRLLHGTPPGRVCALHRQHPLVPVLLGPWLGASTLPVLRLGLLHLQAPLTDGCRSAVDAACPEALWHVAGAPGEAIREPDAMAEDRTRAAVVFVACGLSEWCHVWLPIGVCAWFVRVQHRSEYLTGQAAGSTT
jgi:hypothetical protein